MHCKHVHIVDVKLWLQLFQNMKSSAFLNILFIFWRSLDEQRIGDFHIRRFWDSLEWFYATLPSSCPCGSTQPYLHHVHVVRLIKIIFNHLIFKSMYIILTSVPPGLTWSPRTWLHPTCSSRPTALACCPTTTTTPPLPAPTTPAGRARALTALTCSSTIYPQVIVCYETPLGVRFLARRGFNVAQVIDQVIERSSGAGDYLLSFQSCVITIYLRCSVRSVRSSPARSSSTKPPTSPSVSVGLITVASLILLGYITAL